MPLRGERGLGEKNKSLLEECKRICSLYQPITVRGVCYKLFVAGLIPKMAKNETNKISDLLTRGRKMGVIPWEWIVDESRRLERYTGWADLADYADTIEYGYRKDPWQTQDTHLQVWSEKSTIGGVIRPVLRDLSVSFMVIHGYSSQTVSHDLAKESKRDTRKMVILYVGDHDPSGMDISESDLPERMEEEGVDVEIRRIALLSILVSPEDVRGLPSNEMNKDDKRMPGYIRRYGPEAWEVDAMDPNVLRARLESAIKEYIDQDAWDRMKLIEEAEKLTLQRVAATLRE